MTTKMNVRIHRNDKTGLDEKDVFDYEKAVVHLSKNNEWFYVYEDKGGDRIGATLAIHPASRVDMIEMTHHK